jgi:hypothetical protein
MRLKYVLVLKDTARTAVLASRPGFKSGLYPGRGTAAAERNPMRSGKYPGYQP